MDVSEVNERVEQIREIAGDDERAHSEEDKLWFDVLDYISKNCSDDNCRWLAGNAILTKAIDFERWCA